MDVRTAARIEFLEALVVVTMKGLSRALPGGPQWLADAANLLNGLAEGVALQIQPSAQGDVLKEAERMAALLQDR